MKEIPNILYKNELNKTELNDLLISLIDSSKNFKARAQYIKIFGKVLLRNESNFQFLENFVVSDENPNVRSNAIKAIFFNFPRESLKLLDWMICNERSITVLNSLFKIFKISKLKISEFLLQKLISRLNARYGVSNKEAIFLLELENDLDPNGEIGFFKPIIRNNNIIALDFAAKKIKNLPNSIGSLYKLEHLNLWDNRLTNLPQSIENLTSLEFLYLDWNRFDKFPDIQWSKLKSLKKLSYTNNFKLNSIPNSLIKLIKQNFIRKYINEGVNSEEALVLGLLEILSGMKLHKSKRGDKLSNLYGCNYKLDNKGHIYGIYLYGYHSFHLRTFTEHLCSLKFLEELVLRDQDIEEIPKDIVKLEKLKFLDLKRNNIKLIPEFIKELRSLEYLDLEENEILEIPMTINLSSIDFWV